MALQIKIYHNICTVYVLYMKLKCKLNSKSKLNPNGILCVISETTIVNNVKTGMLISIVIWAQELVN